MGRCFGITRELRINEEITAPRVRLIAEEGEQVGIVPVQEARERAQQAGLDLVEVAPEADPPVCRLMDYGKYKYKQKKKVHQSKTRQHTARLKELRLKLKTDKHDVAIKEAHARKFLEKKHKVLVTMVFRGHLEIKHSDLGLQVLTDFAKNLEGVSKIEKAPSLDGRRMQMILAPK